jgi:hypothetical protein
MSQSDSRSYQGHDAQHSAHDDDAEVIVAPAELSRAKVKDYLGVSS